MYEIVVGRTVRAFAPHPSPARTDCETVFAPQPFETSEEEPFLNREQLEVYCALQEDLLSML